jgi:hypothetical protein
LGTRAAVATRAASSPSSAVAVSVMLLAPEFGLTVRLTIPAKVPPAIKVSAYISASHTFLLSSDSIKIYRDRLAKQIWPYFGRKEPLPASSEHHGDAVCQKGGSEQR